MIIISEERRLIYSRRFYSDSFIGSTPPLSDMVMHYHEGEDQSLLQDTHLSLKDKYNDKPNTAERIKLSHALTKKVIGMSELYEIDCSIYQYERR